MSTSEIQLSCQLGHAPSNQTAQRNLAYMPMVDHTKTVNKMANGSEDTFDGYRFYTDWNGTSNPMATNNGDIFATDRSNGLRFYTTDTIGKDRDLYYQYWDRTNSNLWLPNVIGFTGMWYHNHAQTHPRLQMVCFHYMDANGARAGDYRPTEAFKPYSNSSHDWTYGNTGQHDSVTDWWIGYQLPANRRSTVYNSRMYLMGISFHIRYRTSSIARHADGTFWNFKPIIAKDTGGASLSTAATCESGKRLVIPARGNTYPKSGNSIKLT